MRVEHKHLRVIDDMTPEMQKNLIERKQCIEVPNDTPTKIVLEKKENGTRLRKVEESTMEQLGFECVDTGLYDWHWKKK